VSKDTIINGKIWCKFIIPALVRLRQENFEFMANLG
jgi:hypothetical protein